MKSDDRIELQKVRDFGDVMSDTFKILRQGIRPLGKSMIYFAGPFIVMLSVVTGLFNEEMAVFWNRMVSGALQGIRPSQGLQSDYYSAVFGVKYFVIIFLSFITSVILQLLVYEFITLYKDKDYREITPGDILRASKRDFWMILFTNFGLGLFSALSITILLIAGFINVFIMPLSVILIIVLGVYFLVTLALVPVIRINERSGFFVSFGRSIVLMYGNWWKTFGLLIVLFLVIIIMSIGLGLPYMAVNFFAVFHNIGAESSPFLKAIFILANTINMLGYLLYSILMTGVAFQYYNAVEKKEGRGLLRKLDELS